MTSASVKEQGDTIRYIVNSSPDEATARDRYSALEGVDLSEDVADGIFNNELQKKFPPQPSTQEITARIKELERKLQP